ncbi:hypothetical protein N665_0277s0004 [Sinapis alba]|nr:hypothetical protein N665_0277s0004 [Sinapis alba]
MELNLRSHGRCLLLWHHQDSHPLMDGGGSLYPKFSCENGNLDDAASVINGYPFPLSFY